MRRRVEDNAETRRFLFGYLLAISESDLPGRSLILLHRLNAQPEGRELYKPATKACRFTSSQMAHAVEALVDAGLVVRDHDDKDARQTLLVLTKKARSVLGPIFTSAESVD